MINESKPSLSPDLQINTRPQLVLYGSDSDLLEQLRQHSTRLPYISFAVGYGREIAEGAHLDALWLTLMASVELFGTGPSFPLHEAGVLRTPSVYVKRGFPRYGIVGVAVSPDDPRTPEHNLRLVLSALLAAVKDFNSRSPDPILRVGILPDDLELRKIDAAEAFRIIQKVYEEHFP